MKLPNVEKAIVPEAKVVHYLLSPTHRDGQHKAAFLRSFGFKPESWTALSFALFNHAFDDVIFPERSCLNLRDFIRERMVKQCKGEGSP